MKTDNETDNENCQNCVENTIIIMLMRNTPTNVHNNVGSAGRMYCVWH